MSEPPNEVRAAAAGLGALRRVDRLVTMGFYRQVAVSLVLLSVAGVVFVSWLMTRSADSWLRIVLFVGTLGGIGYVAWLLVAGLRRARTVGEVDLYEYDGGFVRTSRLNTIAFPWSGVVFVENVYAEGGGQSGIAQRRVYFLRRQDELGRTTEPLDLPRDVDRIAALVTAATLPDALAAARSPAGASFGAVTVSPDGVTISGETTSWSDVHAVVREKDEIRVYRSGQPKPWRRTPIGTVPNAPVMLEVVAQLQAGGPLTH